MISLRHTALGLALSLAFCRSRHWRSPSSILALNGRRTGKEVDSRRNVLMPPIPTTKLFRYKGNYEQSLSAGIAAFRTGNAPALLCRFMEVGTAR